MHESKNPSIRKSQRSQIKSQTVNSKNTQYPEIFRLFLPTKKFYLIFVSPHSQFRIIMFPPKFPRDLGGRPNFPLTSTLNFTLLSYPLIQSVNLSQHIASQFVRVFGLSTSLPLLLVAHLGACLVWKSEEGGKSLLQYELIW